jgi:hypothetical protein
VILIKDSTLRGLSGVLSRPWRKNKGCHLEPEPLKKISDASQPEKRRGIVLFQLKKNSVPVKKILKKNPK